MSSPRRFSYRGAEVMLERRAGGLLIQVETKGHLFRIETGRWTVGWAVDLIHEAMRQITTGQGRFSNYRDPEYDWLR